MDTHSTESFRLRIAYLLGYTVVVYGALRGLPSQAEHEAHLFLASHYARDFFSLWDTRWYSGFWVTGHPPLLHQLVGLIAKMPGIGLEHAYGVTLVLAYIGLLSGTQRFLEALQEETTNYTVLIFLAVHPFIHLFVFPLGQTPFVASVGVGFYAAAHLLESSNDPAPKRLVAATLLWTAAMTIHPLGAMPVAVALVLIVANMHGHYDARRVYMELGTVTLATAVITVLALFPFIEWQVQSQTRGLGLEKISLEQGSPWAWGSLALSVGFLGLAWRESTVPLPRRLAWVSIGFYALSFLPYFPLIAKDKLLWFGACFATLPLGWSTSLQTRRTLGIGVALLMLMVTARLMGSGDHSKAFQHSSAMRELAGVLNNSGTRGYRYATIGIGAKRLELGRRVKLPSVDGGMPWIKASPELNNTPYYSYDELPLSQPLARSILRRLLREGPDAGLKWVLSRGDRAPPLLEGQGYRVQSAWPAGLVLWVHDGAKRAPSPPAPKGSAPARLGWGVLPILSLALGLVFTKLSR